MKISLLLLFIVLMLNATITGCNDANSANEVCQNNADCVSFCETVSGSNIIAACDSAKQCVCIDMPLSSNSETVSQKDLQEIANKIEDLSKKINELKETTETSDNSNSIQSIQNKLNQLEQYLNALQNSIDTPEFPNTNISRDDIQNIQQQIDDLKCNLSSILDPLYPVPTHYQDYIKQKIDVINSHMEDSFPFVFITDLHFSSNPQNSLPLLREIIKHTRVRTIISGGDYVYAFGNDKAHTAGMDEELNIAKNALIKYATALYPNWFSLRGNHDFTIKANANENSGITWDDATTKKLLIGSSAQWRMEFPEPEIDFRKGNVKENYTWQITDESSKVRIIGFGDFSTTNTSNYWGVSESKSDEMVNYLAQLLRDSDGYTIILATHGPLSKALAVSNTDPTQMPDPDSKDFMLVLEAFVARKPFTVGKYTTDFTKSTGVLAACISGHKHQDRSATKNGVLYIGTTSDAPYGDDKDPSGKLLVERRRSTDKEQAFDVFLLDTKAKKIKTVRIGAGHKDVNSDGINREFDFPKFEK